MGSKEEEKRKEISIIRFAMPHLAISTLSVWNVTHVESYSKKQMNKINWFVVGVVSINWKHCHNSCMILKWKGPYISMYRYHTLMTVFDHVFFVSNSILWINRKKCETFVGVSFCVSAVAGERDKKKIMSLQNCFSFCIFEWRGKNVKSTKRQNVQFQSRNVYTSLYIYSHICLSILQWFGVSVVCGFCFGIFVVKITLFSYIVLLRLFFSRLFSMCTMYKFIS